MIAQVKTNWKQVYALLALNAAVVISWIAYHNYQPKVLELFHFTELSFFLVVAQAIILVLIPPLAGIVGDYTIKKGGNNFIVFTVGISVTAMVFMCVAFIMGTTASLNLAHVLPFMIVIWLISMNIFHSPANSMLELFAPGKELPSAMALMVMTTDLLYAFENKVVDFVDWIGPVSTFALGGVLLIATGYFFRRTTRSVSFVREHDEATSHQNNFVVVVTVGLLLGLATAIIQNVLPTWIRIEENSFIPDSSWLVSIVLLVAAIAAWPFSLYIQKIGLNNAIRYGLLGTFSLLFIAYVAPQANLLSLGLCMAIGLCYSLASVAAFPLALTNLSAKSITLGAGIFFGSVELCNGIIDILSAKI